MKNAKSVIYFILMHLGFLVYASYAVLGKIASRQDFLSFVWLCIYAGVFVILMVYALIWQQVLKVIPLVIATANKTITIVWGILFGRLIFGEEIKLHMIIGAAIIICGIVILSVEKKDPDSEQLEQNHEQ